jgi:hypothetical protein
MDVETIDDEVNAFMISNGDNFPAVIAPGMARELVLLFGNTVEQKDIYFPEL